MESKHVNTNGGTFIQGNVHAGRDFVGRDKIENHIYTYPTVNLSESLDRGLRQLKSKAFHQAVTTLQEVIKIDPNIRVAYYYLALALLRGQRPKVLSRSEILEIDEVLATAIGINNSDGLFYWFRALLRDDYFNGNRINCPSPSINEIISGALSAKTDVGELRTLLQEIYLPNNQLYKELVRQVA